MVDLPTVPRRNVTTEAARSRVSGADIAAPFQTIADAMTVTGRVATDWAERTEQALESEKRNQIDLGISELQRQYAGKPGELEPALRSFQQRVGEGVRSARLQDALSMYAGNVATRALDQERDREFSLSQTRAENADKARIQTLATRAASLARNGQGGSEDYQRAIEEINAIRARRVDNPLAPYSPEEADLDAQVLTDDLTLEAIYGTVERAFNGTDGDPAARGAKALEHALGLVKQGGFKDAATAEKKVTDLVRGLVALGKQEQGALKEDIESAVEEVQGNPRVAGDPDFERLEADARAKGLHREAGRLRRAREQAGFSGGVRMDPAYRRDVLRGGAVAPNVVDRIIGVESGGRADAANPNSTALGAGQFIESTWLSTIQKHRPDLAEGRTRDEILALRTDANVSREMVEALARDNAEVLRANGIPVTPGTTYLAHFAGAQGAVNLIDAGPEATAEDVLGKEVVDANPFLKGKTAGEVVAWADAKMGGSIAVSAEELKAARAQQKIVDDDPLQVWNMTRDASQPDARLADLDFSNDEALQNEFGKRITAARWVRDLEDLPEVAAFQAADATAFASAVASGDPQVVSRAMTTLAALPDDVLGATVRMPAVKDALAQAASTDNPGVYLPAMSALDELYAKAPVETAKALGKDGLDRLQDYQARLRYYSAEEIGEQLRARSNPAAAKRIEEIARQGEGIARKVSIETVLDGFDPGIFAAEPSAPLDPGTRDALMADYERLVGERYAGWYNGGKAPETVPSVVHEQAMQRLRLTWGRSDVNGGRLTLYPPEQTYLPVDGSYDWMRDQLNADLTEALGREPGPYSVVADRKTETDIAAGRPASYLVVTVDPDTGLSQLVRDDQERPLRYSWDAGNMRADAREKFNRDRQRILAPTRDQRAIQDRMLPPWRGPGLPRDNTFPQSAAELRARLTGG